VEHSQKLAVKETDRMEKKTFSIPNISCGHCVKAIKNELSELDGVKTVEGNPEAKSIDVEWEAPITEDKIKQTLKEINYPAA
jgi:copper chaperone